MSEDPIIDEIHQIREKIFRECGEDLGEVMKRIRAEEKTNQERLIGPEEFKRLAAQSAEPVPTS